MCSDCTGLLIKDDFTAHNRLKRKRNLAAEKELDELVVLKKPKANI